MSSLLHSAFVVYKPREFQVNYIVPYRVTKDGMHRFAIRLAYR